MRNLLAIFVFLFTLNSNAEVCDLYLTNCETKCSNGYGYLCPPGRSCNPLFHYCEKNLPKFDREKVGNGTIKAPATGSKSQ